MKPKLRKTIDDFFTSEGGEEVDPSNYLSKEEIERQHYNLDAFQLAIEHEIPDFALDRTYDCFDTEEDIEIRRALIFSKGMQEDLIMITPEGTICVFDGGVDRELLATVGNTMNLVVRKKAPPKDN